MNLTITRDSVCAADDIDCPHKRIFRNLENKKYSELLRQITENYLPQKIVNGSLWKVFQDEIEIGLIEYPSQSIKILIEDQLIVLKKGSVLFAEYIVDSRNILHSIPA